MAIRDYLILPCRAGFVFAIHSALAAFIYSCMWLLEQFIHLFSSSQPMLFDYVPLRYIFDAGAALMIGAMIVHGLKDVWIALESGQALQCLSTSRDAACAAQHGDGSD